MSREGPHKALLLHLMCLNIPREIHSSSFQEIKNTIAKYDKTMLYGVCVHVRELGVGVGT